MSIGGGGQRRLPRNGLPGTTTDNADQSGRKELRRASTRWNPSLIDDCWHEALTGGQRVSSARNIGLAPEINAEINGTGGPPEEWNPDEEIGVSGYGASSIGSRDRRTCVVQKRSAGIGICPVSVDVVVTGIEDEKLVEQFYNAETSSHVIRDRTSYPP